MSDASRGGVKIPSFGVLTATGNYRNWLTQNKFATNPAVGTSFEDVWNNGGTETY